MKASDFEQELATIVPTPEITMLEKAWSFTKSVVKHVADGLRKCTKEELESRLAVCKTCDQFTGSGCKVCGCNCTGTYEFMNKLAWASESCPLDPPKWDRIDV